MPNPYHTYVQNMAAELYRAKGKKVSGVKPVVEKKHKVLLFSPHPDDECITGLLPLRFQIEAGVQIINVPMTFGSKVERRQERLEELESACKFLGWQNSLERYDLENLTVEDVISVLKEFSPVAIFFPHEKDWNSRHIEVHKLVMKGLGKMPAEFSTMVVETEYWGAMDDPNVHVEGTSGLVADLVAATALHLKEVERNPYHLRLPAWMQDNVRRGAELVGGQGEVAPDYSFSTLYKIQLWKDGALQRLYKGGKNIAAGGANLLDLTIWR